MTHPAETSSQWRQPSLRWRPLGLVATFVSALIALPIGFILTQLLFARTDLWDHLASTLLPTYLRETLILVVSVSTSAAVIGIAAAWLIVMCRFPGRRLFEWLMVVPLAIPAYVLAYVYYEMTSAGGPLSSPAIPSLASLPGATFVLTLTLYPYVYLMVRASFLQQSASLIDATRTLGAGPWTLFIQVVLPMARPAMVIGVALVAMETMADFGAVSLLGVQTFTTGIYRTWFSLGDPVAAAHLAAIFLLPVILLFTFERFSRRRVRYDEDAAPSYRPAAIALAPAKAAAASLFCTLVVFFAVLLPVGRLAQLTMNTRSSALWNKLAGLAWNSFSIGLITAVTALVLGLVIIYGVRHQGGAILRLTARLASFGYAVPGPVIAVGTLLPLAAFDNWLADGILAITGVDPGLLLTGGLAALVLAYLIRFMTVALGAIDAGMAKVRPSLDAAAAVLGASPLRRLVTVQLPLIWPSLLTAAIVVMVDVIKELPATLVLRPFNFDTLAVATFDLARDERLAEAALPALALVAIGLLPVIILTRRWHR